MITIELEHYGLVKELVLITNVTWDTHVLIMYQGDQEVVGYQVDVDGVTQAGLESLWKILRDDNFRKGIWTFDKLDTVVKK